MLVAVRKDAWYLGWITFFSWCLFLVLMATFRGLLSSLPMYALGN